MNDPQNNDFRKCDSKNNDITAYRYCPDAKSKFRTRLSAFGKVAQQTDPPNCSLSKPLRRDRILRSDATANLFKIAQSDPAEQNIRHVSAG